MEGYGGNVQKDGEEGMMGGFGRNVHLMLGVGMKDGRVIKRLKWLQWRKT